MATVLEVVGGSSSFNATGWHLLHSSPPATCCSSSSSRRKMMAGAGPEAAMCSGFSSSSGSSSGSSRSSSLLPTFTGLKVSFPRRPRQRSHSRYPGRAQGHKGIVSEAQETAIAAEAVNDSTLKKLLLESEVPVLVDFWAPWCGPCRMIAPLIDELARQYAGKLKCLKINTDESPDAVAEYGIRSIPTVIIFVGGEKRDTVIGAVPKSNLTSTIDKYLE